MKKGKSYKKDLIQYRLDSAHEMLRDAQVLVGTRYLSFPAPLCIAKKEVDEGLEIFEEAVTMSEKEQGLR